jgi:hypothetical protein
MSLTQWKKQLQVKTAVSRVVQQICSIQKRLSHVCSLSMAPTHYLFDSNRNWLEHGLFYGTVAGAILVDVVSEPADEFKHTPMQTQLPY